MFSSCKLPERAKSDKSGCQKCTQSSWNECSWSPFPNITGFIMILMLLSVHKIPNRSSWEEQHLHDHKNLQVCFSSF